MLIFFFTSISSFPVCHDQIYNVPRTLFQIWLFSAAKIIKRRKHIRVFLPGFMFVCKHIFSDKSATLWWGGIAFVYLCFIYKSLHTINMQKKWFLIDDLFFFFIPLIIKGIKNILRRLRAVPYVSLKQCCTVRNRCPILSYSSCYQSYSVLSRKRPIILQTTCLWRKRV